jgi:hypothetical protein
MSVLSVSLFDNIFTSKAIHQATTTLWAPQSMMNLGLWSTISLSYRESVGLTVQGSARRKAATYTGKHKHRINANIHISSGIQTHDPSV